KKRKSLKPDIFHAFDINPLHEYKYVSLLSQYVTDMGRIISREKTGLTKINQRRVSKAIRRARAFGLMPVTYKSPVMFEPNKKL
ncbi:37S ribosomal protein S18, partial [Ramicandelaber brevisporus]